MLLSTREQKELRALYRRKIRVRERRFVAEGIRVVEDLLVSGLGVVRIVAVSSLEDDARGAALLAQARAGGIPVGLLDGAEFSRLADTETPQGILAIGEIPQSNLDELAPTGGADVLLVADAIQDPGNLGTLIRTAEALGARGVVALEGTVDPWNPKVVRAAMGSSFRRPVVEATWDEAVYWLRERGFRILASAAGGSALQRAGGPTALVLGNEGAGISASILHEADATVGIELRGRAESLNVSAAAAILLYELTRSTR